MSRLAAALERAATGLVGRREVPAEPAVSIDRAVSDEPSSGEQIEVDSVVVADAGTLEREPARFHEFNSDYVDKLVVSNTVVQTLREQYRRLAATLHHAQEEGGIKTLMVTSAVPDEGKTLTVTNIALTLSESYRRRVLLIDADLRRPSLDEVFKMPKGFGLNEALTGRADRKVSIIQVSRHLSLLTAGAPDPDPMSKLTSDRMRKLIKEASAAFDWVILDTPPIAILTDATLLGSMVDGALLVVRAGRTPADLVKRAVDSLGKNRILGVVLNRGERRAATGSYYYNYDSYYYSTSRTRPVGDS